jgi:glutamate synthase domain-containing protein 2
LVSEKDHILTDLEKITHKHTQALRNGFVFWSNNPTPPPALGDKRWTADLILSNWIQAETGKIPPGTLESNVGHSGGGFDRLIFKTLPESERILSSEPIDLSMLLNRRKFGHKIEIPVPWYGAGMSYGSVSEEVMLARDWVITQVATGMFGVREETIQRARIVEFKYAQGAKPGLGGHLLADKATTTVAAMRESVPWVSLFSPFPFHSVYSVEDHRKHVDWVRAINPDALVSVKVSTPSDVDMVAVGSYFAGANILHIDGSYGGTGAAPDIAKKNIALPIEYAIPKVHKYLESEGIRDEVVLIASGGIRTAHDIAKAIALGADGCVLGTAEIVAIGCTRCANCERGRGCPFGITTTDPELSLLIDPAWGAMRIGNLYRSMQLQLAELLRSLGLKKVSDLRGRTDFLRYQGAHTSS